ncbi:HNH endonuclease family protein [Corynebacterium meitnerae]|uniref:HNH endonuclease family protein n=1 Tax=Corynebacterium meitnerae TaxID=2913498 RepID=UPI0022BA5156|nr:HNH endonuclease family protein [Corynebacterium meitnerae]
MKPFHIYLGALTALTVAVVPLPFVHTPPISTTLTLPSRETAPDYTRAKFGDGWAYQPTGCTTRETAMAAAYDQPTCSIPYSQWEPVTITDPYTGDPLPPEDVELDHVFPLRAAWDMGAHSWSDEKRRTFANDPANLIVTSSAANQSKSDKLPSQWLPSSRSYRCDYSRRLATVANAYGLPVTRADKAAMRRSCATLPAMLGLPALPF